MIVNFSSSSTFEKNVTIIRSNPIATSQSNRKKSPNGRMARMSSTVQKFECKHSHRPQAKKFTSFKLIIIILHDQLFLTLKIRRDEWLADDGLVINQNWLIDWIDSMECWCCYRHTLQCCNEFGSWKAKEKRAGDVWDKRKFSKMRWEKKRPTCPGELHSSLHVRTYACFQDDRRWTQWTPTHTHPHPQRVVYFGWSVWVTLCAEMCGCERMLGFVAIA